MNSGNLSEIMESLQGEGLLVGSRQVFLRFTGCNLRCDYCDTPDALKPVSSCKVCCHTGARTPALDISNPLQAQNIAAIISRHYSSRWISLTGGEPLLWPSFIIELASILAPQGYSFLLETNGTLYDALEKCLPWIDIISMDWKLPSAVGFNTQEMHQAFLKSALKKTCYIKIVVTSDSGLGEIQEAFNIISSIDSNLPVILQIASPGESIKAPAMDRMLEMQRQGLVQLSDVRILPQMHRMLDLI